MFPAVVNTSPRTRTGRRNRVGCIFGCLTTFVLLLLIIGVAWLFVLQPYLHNIAEAELDQAMTSAVNQIPTQAAELSAGSVIPVREAAITNLIVLNLAPSNPVKNPQTHITTQNISLDFQIYGNACAIVVTPQVRQGQLEVTNVQVQGIIGFIMSPEQVTTLINTHLQDAQQRLHHTITNVQMQNHVMNLTLG